jgi:hypothetical protein
MPSQGEQMLGFQNPQTSIESLQRTEAFMAITLAAGSGATGAGGQGFVAGALSVPASFAVLSLLAVLEKTTRNGLLCFKDQTDYTSRRRTRNR